MKLPAIDGVSLIVDSVLILLLLGATAWLIFLISRIKKK